MGGFNWDAEEYTESEGGGDFLNEDEFDKLRLLDAVLYATAVREDVNTYEGKTRERFLLDFVDPEGKDKTKAFIKGNAERDARIRRIQNTLLADPEEPFAFSFGKIKKRHEIVAPKGEV